MGSRTFFVTDRIEYFAYDEMVEEALRGVLRKALTITARQGLPGDHHFYITFQSQHPGVQMAASLRAQHPDSMTIVLQNQFWDLVVDDDHFAVTLSFGGRRERIAIPFAAITAFADPHATFGLQFQNRDDDDDPWADPIDDDEDDEDDDNGFAPFALPRDTTRGSARGSGDRAGVRTRADRASQDDDGGTGSGRHPDAAPFADPNAPPDGESDGAEGEGNDPSGPTDDDGNGGTNVVTLDRFRKKP